MLDVKAPLSRAMAVVIAVVMAFTMVPLPAYGGTGLVAGSVLQEETDGDAGPDPSAEGGDADGSDDVDGSDGVYAPLAISPLSDEAYSGGSGTESDPFKIGDDTDLYNMADDINSGKNNTASTYFRLTADIELSDLCSEESGES